MRPINPNQSMAPSIANVDWASQQQEMEQQARETYGGPSRSIFTSDFLEGKSQWKFGTGKHILNTIPWLAGPKHPRVLVGKMREGMVVYNVEIYVHKNARPDLPSVICLAKTLGQECPICNYRNTWASNPPANMTADQIKEYLKTLYPARNPICGYNFSVFRNMVFEAPAIAELSGFFFEKYLRSAAQAPLEVGQGPIVFQSPKAGPQGGRHIIYDVVGGETWAVNGFSFQERAQEIPLQILQAAFPLDEGLYLPSTDEVYTLFHGAEGASETQFMDEQPAGQQDGQYQSQPGQSQYAAAGGPTCPFGGVIGTDFNQYEECRQCVVNYIETYNACGSMSPAAAGSTPAPAYQPPPQQTQQPVQQQPPGQAPQATQGSGGTQLRTPLRKPQQ